MAYYYLLAALPLLRFGEAPALDRAALLAACGDVLAGEAMQAVEALSRGEHSDAKGFPRVWQARDTQLRNAIARERVGRGYGHAERHQRPHRGFDVAVERAVSDAFARPTPLERERALDTTRWALADELAGHDAFARDAVYAYAVKHHLAARWAALDEEAGAQRLATLVDTMAVWRTDA